MAKRRNNFLLKYGKGKERFWDLVLKTFAVAGLFFVSTFLKRLDPPIVDKRGHLMMQASRNVADLLGDRGLKRWFQVTKWDVFVMLEGPDNGYIARDFLVFEECMSLIRAAELKGEKFPNGKTPEYVEREIIKKNYDKVKNG